MNQRNGTRETILLILAAVAALSLLLIALRPSLSPVMVEWTQIEDDDPDTDRWRLEVLVDGPERGWGRIGIIRLDFLRAEGQSVSGVPEEEATINGS